mgnify:CR=1 FL=1
MKANQCKALLCDVRIAENRTLCKAHWYALPATIHAAWNLATTDTERAEAASMAVSACRGYDDDQATRDASCFAFLTQERRDKFAMAALSGLKNSGARGSEQWLANEAWSLADAMLAMEFPDE